MSIKRNIIGIVGVVSVIVLGLAILFRPNTKAPELNDTPQTPEEELELFLADRMNYGVQFSVILAEKRIERAEQIGREHPELSADADAVVDSLRARLQRKAVIE